MDQVWIESRIARSDRDVIESRSLAQVDIRGATSVCRIRYTLSDAQSRSWRAIRSAKSRAPLSTSGALKAARASTPFPEKAAMDVDLRSGADAELQRLDSFFRRAVREAAMKRTRADGREILCWNSNWI